MWLNRNERRRLYKTKQNAADDDESGGLGDLNKRRGATDGDGSDKLGGGFFGFGGGGNKEKKDEDEEEEADAVAAGGFIASAHRLPVVVVDDLNRLQRELDITRVRGGLLKDEEEDE